MAQGLVGAEEDRIAKVKNAPVNSCEPISVAGRGIRYTNDRRIEMDTPALSVASTHAANRQLGAELLTRMCL